MTIHKKNHLQQGFTIVELLLYMGIFSILLFVFVQLFAMVLDARIQAQATSAVSQDGNFIVARLTKDIHESNSISIPSSTELDLSGGTSAYTYKLVGSTLQLTDAAGTDQLNSTNTRITSITFTKITDSSGAVGSVQVVFTIASLAVQRGVVIQTESFETAVETR